jgi:hypothetical protein
MKKIILQLIIFGLVRVASAQNTQFTNVDTSSYLKPNWSKNNLSTTDFRNGESILTIKDLDIWTSTLSKNNPSLVFISNNDEYYYNYAAISDERKLCPFGYKVPNYYDFVRNRIKLFPSGMLDCSMGSYELFRKSDNSTYLATNTNSTIDISYYSAAYLYKENSVKVDEWPVPKNNGLSVRCLEDLDEIIQDSTFDYKRLLPIEYKELLFNLFTIAKKESTNIKQFEFHLQGIINCEKTGFILGHFSKCDILSGKINNQSLLQKMNEIIDDFHTAPYYHGKILKAHSDLSLVFIFDRIKLDKKYFSFSMLKNQEINGLNDLNYGHEHSFKRTAYMESLKIQDGGNDVLNGSTNYLSSFKSKGPIYAIGCILPGLGMSLLTQNNFNSYHRRGFKKMLLISSISLGAISVVSKMYSNRYYSRYKNDLFGATSNSNYNKANTLQKVFLTSGIGYCLLGVIDFTWTFAIGCKNKSIQNKLNNQIKDVPSDFILK